MATITSANGQVQRVGVEDLLHMDAYVEADIEPDATELDSDQSIEESLRADGAGRGQWEDYLQTENALYADPEEAQT